MLPAVWGAVKAASLGQKAAVVGGFCLLLSGCVVFGWFKGKASCEKSHQIEMMAQAMAVAEHTIDREDALDAVEEAHQKIEDQREARERVVYREVIKYVQAPKKSCLLDPEYVRLVDQLLELRTSSESRVLEADTVSPGSEELHAAHVSTDQLLLAFTALSNARERDVGMIERMKSLDAVRYAKEMRFWLDLPPEARGDNE